METFTPYNQILISRYNYVYPIWIFIFDIDQAQINSVLVCYWRSYGEKNSEGGWWKPKKAEIDRESEGKRKEKQKPQWS